MFQKRLRTEYITLCAKIKDLNDREMQAVYASAKGEPHENMIELAALRWDAEDKASKIRRQLNKPTIIRRIRKVVRK